MEERVSKFVFEQVAKAFEKDEGELSLETNFIKELQAKSLQFFPLISAIEDEYDLELEYQPFRRNFKTIGDLVAFIVNECK